MTIKTLIDAKVFMADVEINGSDLDSGYREQAALFAHYAMLQFEAMRQASMAKIVSDTREAQIDKRLRAELTAAGTKITEKLIEQGISLDPDYITALREYNDAQAIQKLTENCLEALKQRKDMLIQMGATSRKEMDGDMVMRSTSATSEALREASRRAVTMS